MTLSVALSHSPKYWEEDNPCQGQAAPHSLTACKTTAGDYNVIINVLATYDNDFLTKSWQISMNKI